MTLEQILQFVGPGPLAAIIAVAWLFTKFVWPTIKQWKDEDQQLKSDDIKAREKDNTLRRCQIKLDLAILKWLKEQGQNVEIPDLTNEI